ncbi:MAG: cysteine--tRNA ligase [Candidatus Micrarchaeota archaeon]|nr:cysteine--tRNA ligase [Candidatus Micrarchaeota archaeon]
MEIYNTLTHKKERFRSITKGKVGMYSCGPTVYNFAHIGNLRPYIFSDILKRMLMRDGYSVTHVMNITDVGHLVSDANLGEDKIRLTAEHEHKSAHEVAEFYTKEFVKDIRRLNLMMPDVMPKATAHIKEMLGLIATLEEKGYLYNVRTGVYYDTSKFKDYGQLMGLTFDKLNDYLIAGARVERAAGIRNTTDFAVWRFAKGDEKEMVWETKYGRGFPGWHIECSAMSMRYLGEHFDIHTGGVDHLPIHHTNEIAQSEAATGMKFVNFWIHVEHLQVNGKKMSKSLGNVYTLQHLVDKGYSVNAYKYLIISGYYRSQMNFTFEALENATNTLNGIYSFIEKVSEASRKGHGNGNSEFTGTIEGIRDAFFSALNNDLNTPLALSKLHMLISETNRAYEAGLSKSGAKKALDALLEFDEILGLDFGKYTKKKELPEGAKDLIDERNRLRSEKKFKEADRIREKLRNEYRIDIEDTEGGTAWHNI